MRYEAPTPLHTEIAFRARSERRDGRKIFFTADAWHGDRRFASSKATFIVVESMDV